jgi:hypothetical protein
MKKTNKNKLCKDSGRFLHNTPAPVQLSMSNANKLDGRHRNRPPPVKARHPCIKCITKKTGCFIDLETRSFRCLQCIDRGSKCSFVLPAASARATACRNGQRKPGGRVSRRVPSTKRAKREITEMVTDIAGDTRCTGFVRREDRRNKSTKSREFPHSSLLFPDVFNRHSICSARN